MATIEIEKVMDRQKIAKTIHDILDVGSELLRAPKYGPQEHSRMKAMRTLGQTVTQAVIMVGQETMQYRLMMVNERMKQLGYNGEEKKAISE